MRGAAGGSCDTPIAMVLEQLAVDPGLPITAVLYYPGNFPLCVPLSCAFAGTTSWSFTAWSDRLVKIR
jgi:hypothetical protein